MLWSVGCIIDMFESEFSVHKPFIIAMPEGHPLAGESRIRVALLADEPLIASSVELELGFGGQIHEIEAEGKFVPRIVNRAPDIPTILCLVAASMGCAFVPASFRRVAMPGIAYRELAGPERNALLAAARRKDNPAPAMKAFIRILKATLERRDWVMAH
jgi:DNA-binding transcriptional LysR family regulator